MRRIVKRVGEMLKIIVVTFNYLRNYICGRKYNSGVNTLVLCTNQNGEIICVWYTTSEMIDFIIVIT